MHIQFHGLTTLANKLLKADFHLHTSDAPMDSVAHSPRRLIDHAAVLGFEVIALTEHEHFSFNSELAAYAESKGVLLIPGVEAKIEEKHVVVINATKQAASLSTFEELCGYRQAHPNSFILAVHPFYPGGKCLGEDLERNIDLFDGIEYSHYYSPWLNGPNKRAEAVAVRHGKPLIGTSDAHLLIQVGRTYTLVDAEKNANAVIAAIRQGKTQLVTSPFSFFECAWIIIRLMGANLIQHLGNCISFRQRQ
jgi:predicted metal-dependent phosphoesterase TrpH